MRKQAYFLLITVLILFLTGSLMVYNTTSAEIIDKALNIELSGAFLRQICYGLVGIIVASFIVYIGIDRLEELSPYILIFLSILLVAVFIPGVGMQLNGARRWIKLFGVSIQPSEFVKIFLPMTLCDYFKRHPIKSFLDFIKLLSRAVIPLFLILIEPDNGTFVILMVVILTLFYLFKINKRYWMIPCFFVLLAAGGIASRMPHVSQRIQVYLHPEKDILGKGHQPYQAKIAVGSGGWLGRGMGQSLQKLNYLPEARSDYIAAIFAEEFGFIGIIFLIGLYLFFALVGVKISIHSHNIFSFYLGMSLVVLVSFQVFLNLGVVSGLLPSKGTNLPFFSQGGSSLVANFLIVGIFMAISKSQPIKNHES
ncbi:MAG: putative lipid II flippase FtsW [Chlamydiae bacterium]|nr:putative lipid II flippase FtsW [Chlamydiota bacterium]